MSSTAVAALVGAGSCLLAAPYLARLTRSVPDNGVRAWWRGASAGRSRMTATGGIAVALGALAGAAAEWHPVLPALLLLALCAAPLVVIDFEHHRLPNRLVAVAAVGAAVLLTVAAAANDDWHPLLRAAEGAAATFGVLYLLAFFSPRSFGLGDVKLGGLLGAYLGWFGWSYVYYGIFAGFLLGAVFSVALLVSRRASMKTAIAFGPMLIVGALVILAFDLVPSTS